MSNIYFEEVEDVPEDLLQHEGDSSELINPNAPKPTEDEPGLASDNADVLEPFLSPEQRRIDPTDEELEEQSAWGGTA
jgi:hypothetical protein